MYRILIMLAILGLLLVLFCGGAYWSDMPNNKEERQQAKEKATTKSDYEKKCRYIFSDNAEWGYILQGLKK